MMQHCQPSGGVEEKKDEMGDDQQDTSTEMMSYHEHDHHHFLQHQHYHQDQQEQSQSQQQQEQQQQQQQNPRTRELKLSDSMENHHDESQQLRRRRHEELRLRYRSTGHPFGSGGGGAYHHRLRYHDQHRRDYQSQHPHDDPNHPHYREQRRHPHHHPHGFSGQVGSFAKVIFGSCGSALEAASLFARGQGCRWPVDGGLIDPRTHNGNHNHNNLHQGGGADLSRQPLSIADELRRLAEKEGRPFRPHHPPGGEGGAAAYYETYTPGRKDIPQFLGEEAVHSFEDDNISALSQYTLEELARGSQQQQLLGGHNVGDDNEDEGHFVNTVSRIPASMVEGGDDDENDVEDELFGDPPPSRIRTTSSRSSDSNYSNDQNNLMAKDMTEPPTIT